MQLTTSYQGILFGVLAYIIWGTGPLYFKYIQHLPTEEIVSHRIIWSIVFVLIIMALAKRWSSLYNIIRQPKTLSWLFVSSLLIGLNWSIYIWAVNHDQLLAASLGYYVTPLMIIMLAMLFLKEKLYGWQLVALGLAMIGVLIQVFVRGASPGLALLIALSFSLFSFIRKYIHVDSLTGMLLEALFISPFAFYFLFGVESQSGTLLENGLWLNIVLISAGIISTLPLIFYAEAALRINLTTLGFLQYIAPTIMWLIAVCIYNEPISKTTLWSFGFIWLGLIVYSLEGILRKIHFIDLLHGARQ